MADEWDGKKYYRPGDEADRAGKTYRATKGVHSTGLVPGEDKGVVWKLVVDETRFPVADWQYEVANGDTRLGYEAWLEGRLDDLGELA